MPLARDDDDVAVLCERDRSGDRAPPIRVDLDVHPCSLEHVLDDRERLLGARVVRGHDRDVRELGGDLSHERSLAAVAVAACAEDDDDAAGPEAAGGAQHRRERVRGVRVVDDHRERLPFVDRLEPSGNAVHARDPLRDRVLVQVEEQPSRNRSENVLDVEGTAQARLDVDSGGAKAAAVRIEGEALGSDLGSVCEPERDERRAMSVLEVVGESPSPRIADVDRSRGRCRAGEESPLRVEVLVHRPVEVEMILTQVREHERVEADPVEPSEHRSVRARLHCSAAVTGVEHLAEEALQIDRLRRRERCRTSRAPDLPLDGAHEAGPPIRGREHRTEQERRRRLPVRSGHACELELLRRLTEEDVRRDGHRLTSRRNEELWHVHVEQALDHDGCRPTLDRLPREVVPVDALSPNAEEERTRRDAACVVCEIADRDRPAPGHLAGREGPDQGVKIHRAKG